MSNVPARSTKVGCLNSVVSYFSKMLRVFTVCRGKCQLLDNNICASVKERVLTFLVFEIQVDMLNFQNVTLCDIIIPAVFTCVMFFSFL